MLHHDLVALLDTRLAGDLAEASSAFREDIAKASDKPPPGSVATIRRRISAVRTVVSFGVIESRARPLRA
jgi:hypothetical protein